MKIGVNTLFLVPGDVGGTEIYFRSLMREMVQLAPEHEFLLFTNRDNHDLLREELSFSPNVRFSRVPVKAANRPARIIAEQTLLPLQLFRTNPDILWSPGYTCPRICPCPQVTTIHDLQYKNFPEDMSRLERLTLDFLVRMACRCNRQIITISEFSKSELVRFNFIDGSKVTVILSGVDPVFHRSHKQKTEPPFILSIAHSYPHKRLDLLAEAFAILEDEIPHDLVLVGKPRRGEPLLREKLQTIKNQQRIKRYDKGVDFERLLDLYGSADLFVLPSVYEGFGLPVIEAMMAGLPVVTTRSASLPEVGGEYAFYAREASGPALAEAIRQCLRMSTPERERHIQAARHWAERFDWQESARTTLDVLYQTGGG